MISNVNFLDETYMKRCFTDMFQECTDMAHNRYWDYSFYSNSKAGMCSVAFL